MALGENPKKARRSAGQVHDAKVSGHTSRPMGGEPVFKQFRDKPANIVGGSRKR